MHHPLLPCCCCFPFTQELPKSEAAAWAAVPGLQQLAAQAGAFLLVACAEAAAEGAAGAEGASKGLEGLGLAGGAAQQQVGFVSNTFFNSVLGIRSRVMLLDTL
jgi:hypothetical protein